MDMSILEKAMEAANEASSSADGDYRAALKRFVKAGNGVKDLHAQFTASAKKAAAIAEASSAGEEVDESAVVEGLRESEGDDQPESV